MPVEAPTIAPPQIPDETQEPITTLESEMPSLEGPDDPDLLHIAKDPDDKSKGTLCGAKPKKPHTCDGKTNEIVQRGHDLYCSGCKRQLCKTCVDILWAWYKSGIKEW